MDVLMRALCWTAMALALIPLLSLLYLVVSKGLHRFDLDFFIHLPRPVGVPGGGMANAIVGTFVLISLASCIGVPVGVLGGVFVSEYAHHRLNWWIRFTADIINGVPSITWGMVVYGLLVVPLVIPLRGTVQSVDAVNHVFTVGGPAGAVQQFAVDAATRYQLGGPHRLDSLKTGADIIVQSSSSNGGTQVAKTICASTGWQITLLKLKALHNSVSGFSTLAGAVVLGLMMIPLILRTTEEVLQLVPNGYREAALALGIAQWRMIVQIVVRTATKGIVTGVLLALARVAGETAPLLFTAFGNAYWTHKLTEPIAALPLQIFAYAISGYDDWRRQAWAGALVLILLVSTINVVVRFLTRDRFSQRSN
jgi:ABC-type phosphate transport system permease subunit